MKRILILILSITLIVANTNANNAPTARNNFQLGNEIIYYSTDIIEALNSTDIIFSIYNSELQLKDIKRVNVSGTKAGHIELLYVQRDKNKLVLSEFLLKEKTFSSNSIIATISSEYTLLFTKNIVSDDLKKDLTDDFFKRDTIDKLPNDHVLEKTIGTSTATERDIRTATGGLIYLRKKQPIIGPSGGLRSLQDKMKENPNTGLYYYERHDSYFVKQWELDLKEENILVYRTYKFNSFIYLYTSYLIENTDKKNETSEQKIRKIDLTSGKIIYEVVLNKKQGYELLLSNVYYDEVSGDFFMTGNYYTLGSTNNSKGKPEDFSYLYVGKISKDGELFSKSYSMSEFENPNFKTNFKQTPILKVLQFCKDRSGNLQLGCSIFLAQNKLNGYSNSSEMFLEIPSGCALIVMSKDLDIVKKQISNIRLEDKKINMVLYETFTAREFLLYNENAPEIGVSSSWDEDNQTMTLSILYRSKTIVQNVTDNTYYVAKYNTGTNSELKKVAAFESNTSLNFSVLLDSTFFHYAESDLYRKPLKTIKID